MVKSYEQKRDGQKNPYGDSFRKQRGSMLLVIHAYLDFVSWTWRHPTATPALQAATRTIFAQSDGDRAELGDDDFRSPRGASQSDKRPRRPSSKGSSRSRDSSGKKKKKRRSKKAKTSSSSSYSALAPMQGN